MWTRASLAVLLPAAALGAAACSSPSASSTAGPAPPASSASAAPPSTPEAKRLPAPVREGGTLARTAAGDALLLADEDHHALRTISLPLTPTSRVQTTPLPGAPAQVLALGDRVLVTVREAFVEASLRMPSSRSAVDQSLAASACS